MGREFGSMEMRKFLCMAVAGAALIASPALAKPGNGHGRGHDKGDHGWQARDDGDRDRGEWRDRHDGDRDRGEWRERDDRRDGDGWQRGEYRSSYRNCPPGLARKHNGCQPPGQARNGWRRGDRLPRGYNGYTSYNQIPRSYRDRYNLDRDGRYVYRDGQVYQVNPRTSIIEQVLGALGR